MAAIALKELRKTFEKGKRVALNGLTAKIHEGAITGIVGPDGAGKTTLLRILSGLMTYDSGECFLFSSNLLTETAKVQEQVSYLPQKFGLYEDLSVSQNLNLYTRLQGVSRDDPHVQRLMKFSGLAPFEERLVGNLSGGMKQKLGLMTALLRKPKLLLLDEPTIGVDPLSQKDLWKMIEELNTQGMTIVLSTSYLNEAENCQQVLVLNDGNLIFSGRPSEFKEIVRGKTFLIENVGKLKRRMLDQIVGTPGIMDAIVEGDTIRVTVSDNSLVKDRNESGIPQMASMKSREPLFEDAFIYILGGVPKRPALKYEEKLSKEDGVRDAVEAVNLTKYFGSFKAVEEVSFSIRKGEIFGLLGPNGAGKSTTFKMLCGLLRPSKGEALVGGVSLREAPSIARSQMGYMAQKFSLYDNMTLMQNMQFFSGIYPVTDREGVIEEMILVFDLKHYISTLAVDLPLGFKQRLALACALMHQPKVLCLDEPTSGVDPLTRREFWHQINSLADSGVAILVSTHLMDEAEYCDRIGLIHQGRLRIVDTPQGLKERVPSSYSTKPTLVDAFSYFCEKIPSTKGDA